MVQQSKGFPTCMVGRKGVAARRLEVMDGTSFRGHLVSSDLGAGKVGEDIGTEDSSTGPHRVVREEDG